MVALVPRGAPAAAQAPPPPSGTQPAPGEGRPNPPATPAPSPGQPAAQPDRPAPKPGEEINERRTKSSKTFATETPGKFKTQVFSQAVHFVDGHGRWADIDTTLQPTGPGRFAPKGSGIDVELAANPQDQALARLSLDKDHVIEFSMKDATRGTARAEKAKMTYPQIRPGVGLELSVQPNGIKEDIVLASKDAGDTFVFPLKLEGLTAGVDPASGDVVYTDGAGVERARTPRGFMQDSAKVPASDEGASSDAVTYRLVPNGGGVGLEVGLDRSWLDDPGPGLPGAGRSHLLPLRRR